MVVFVLVAALHGVATHATRGHEDPQRALAIAVPEQTRPLRCIELPEFPLATTAVRSGNRSLIGHIDDGIRRSETFARLATTIAKHGVLVYVEWRPTMKAGLTGALLHDVFRGADDTTYFRVFVLHGRSRSAVIATIAHELQHVVEVLETGAHDFASAHSGKGFTVRAPRTDLRVYETEAATRVGTAVARELAACNRK